MNMRRPLERWAHHPPGTLVGSHIGEVVAVDDPNSRGRVKVRLYDHDGVGAQDAPLWARVAVPFAGDGRGAFFIPTVGDEVLVTFVNGDPRMPIVIGGLWNGGASPPETLGGDGKSVDRWTIVGKQGTRIAIIEEQGGQPTVSFTTPGGVSGTLSDESGGKIELKTQGTTITVDTSGVSVQTQSSCQLQASSVTVTAPTVTVDAGMAQFSGTIQCNALLTSTVSAATYMTGAGNVL
jgi:uncharacterized protein involved in type VI secretion and phage assembly